MRFPVSFLSMNGAVGVARLLVFVVSANAWLQRLLYHIDETLHQSWEGEPKNS